MVSVYLTTHECVYQLVAMVGVRKLCEKLFTADELAQLDDKMPEITLRKKEDRKKKHASIDEGAVCLTDTIYISRQLCLQYVFLLNNTPFQIA